MIERSVRIRRGRVSVPVSNAHRSWTQRSSAVIELRDGALLGQGEASPLPGYSPDTVEACAAALRDVVVDGLDLAQAQQIDAGLPAARFALETALADLAAQQRGCAVHQLLREHALLGDLRSLSDEPVVDIALQALVTSDDDAARAVARGISTLKIKVGREARSERAFLERLRTRYPDAELRIDANGADFDLSSVSDLRIALCEEPGAALPEGMGLALDESLRSMTPDQVNERCNSERVAMLVLKPTLLGGFTPCLQLASIAKTQGVKIAVSHCFDGPIALAAACELALVVANTASGLARHPALSAYPAAHIAQLRDNVVAATGRSGLALPTHAAFSVAAAEPSREAIITPERTLTFGELHALVSAETTAGAARDGARVIDALPSVDTLVQIYACLELDRPALLLHPRWSAAEKAKQTTRARDVPKDAAVVVFTSGSSGVPKGVVLDREALVASADASAARLGWNHDDRWLLDLSLAHVGGLSIALRALRARRAIVLSTEPFDPARTARLIVDQRVTLASWVPTMLSRMLHELPDWRPPAHLRAVLLGGAAASASLLEHARDRGVPALPTYGMSETASQVATARPGSLALTPLPGVDLRIDDDGRIAVRAPALMRAYLPPHEPLSDAALQDGWLLTCDRGYLDEYGDLQVTGRIDDIIISGGENIDPLEVEAALEAAPGIRAACVVGLPDPRWGQVVAAALEGEPASAEAEHIARACKQIAAFKRPRRIKHVKRLPISANGKLDRAAVRALFA